MKNLKSLVTEEDLKNMEMELERLLKKEFEDELEQQNEKQKEID